MLIDSFGFLGFLASSLECRSDFASPYTIPWPCLLPLAPKNASWCFFYVDSRANLRQPLNGTVVLIWCLFRQEARGAWRETLEDSPIGWRLIDEEPIRNRPLVRLLVNRRLARVMESFCGDVGDAPYLVAVRIAGSFAYGAAARSFACPTWIHFHGRPASQRRPWTPDVGSCDVIGACPIAGRPLCVCVCVWVSVTISSFSRGIPRCISTFRHRNERHVRRLRSSHRLLRFFIATVERKRQSVFI